MRTATISVPPAVRQALGDEAVAEFVPWLDDRVRLLLKQEGVPRDEYQAVLSRLDRLEREVGLVLEEQARLRAELREDIGALHRRIDELIDRFEARFVDMERYLEARLREMNDKWEARLREMDEKWEARLKEISIGWDARQKDTESRWEARVSNIERRLDRMEERLDRMEERLDRMYQQMIVQTRWLIGAVLGIGTVISVLLAIAQFTP